jgi:hypothetical protein
MKDWRAGMVETLFFWISEIFPAGLVYAFLGHFELLELRSGKNLRS